MDIRHEQFQNGGSFYAGTSPDDPVAEMTYRRVGPILFLDHIAVDESLQGAGVARALLDAAVAFAREQGEKIVPICPYAHDQFEQDASLADVLATLPRQVAT